jgi:hypothetical protein
VACWRYWAWKQPHHRFSGREGSKSAQPRKRQASGVHVPLPDCLVCLSKKSSSSSSSSVCLYVSGCFPKCAIRVNLFNARSPGRRDARAQRGRPPCKDLLKWRVLCEVSSRGVTPPIKRPSSGASAQDERGRSGDERGRSDTAPQASDALSPRRVKRGAQLPTCSSLVEPEQICAQRPERERQGPDLQWVSRHRRASRPWRLRSRGSPAGTAAHCSRWPALSVLLGALGLG